MLRFTGKFTILLPNTPLKRPWTVRPPCYNDHMNKMSRTDLLTAAMNAGIPYEDAEVMAYTLSPECRTVAESKVIRAIRYYLGE